MPSLILTLQLDAASQLRFETERQLYFPPDRNLIPAHLTLFHQLPDTPSVRDALSQAAARQPAFSLAVTGLRSLGRGVAYTLASDHLRKLRAQLAESFAAFLTRQDQQPFQPHVVVQNKTTPDLARATLAELIRRFRPSSVEALGLDLWAYRDGPWAFEAGFLFPTSP